MNFFQYFPGTNFYVTWILRNCVVKAIGQIDISFFSGYSYSTVV